MADKVNLIIIAGEAVAYALTITTSGGAAQDITGWHIAMTIKRQATDLDAAALLSVLVTSHTNPTGGLSTINLTADQTNIAAGSYAYDIRAKNASGDLISIQYGTMKVIQPVTRIVA